MTKWCKSNQPRLTKLKQHAFLRLILTSTYNVLHYKAVCS